MDTTGANPLKNDVAPLRNLTGSGTSLSSREEKIARYERLLIDLRSELAELGRRTAALSKTVEDESRHVHELEKELAPVLDQECAVIGALKEINSKKQSASVENRRAHEQGRWKHVEEWYLIEQEKWKIEEKLEAQRSRAAEHTAEQVELKQREVALSQEIHRIETERERERFTSELNLVRAERTEIEKKIALLEEKREKALAQFDTLRAVESDMEKKEAGLEELLSVARSLAEERELVSKRYELEKAQHEIQVERWGIEDEITQLGGGTVESQKLLSELKNKEAVILAKLSALER